MLPSHDSNMYGRDSIIRKRIRLRKENFHGKTSGSASSTIVPLHSRLYFPLHQLPDNPDTCFVREVTHKFQRLHLDVSWTGYIPGNTPLAVHRAGTGLTKQPHSKFLPIEAPSWSRRPSLTASLLQSRLGEARSVDTACSTFLSVIDQSGREIPPLTSISTYPEAVCELRLLIQRGVYDRVTTDQALLACGILTLLDW
jgi:hypothetical protein